MSVEGIEKKVKHLVAIMIILFQVSSYSRTIIPTTKLIFHGSSNVVELLNNGVSVLILFELYNIGSMIIITWIN